MIILSLISIISPFRFKQEEIIYMPYGQTLGPFIDNANLR